MSRTAAAFRHLLGVIGIQLPELHFRLASLRALDASSRAFFARADGALKLRVFDVSQDLLEFGSWRKAHVDEIVAR